jgi:DNA-binding transcriptional ArsR family regulator
VGGWRKIPMSDQPNYLNKLGKWADSFKVIGHPLRLTILFMLYGSEVVSQNPKCLTFGQIREVLGFPENKRALNSLTYHLNELLEANFIEREPFQDEAGKSRVMSTYSLSRRAREFLSDFGLIEKIRQSLKST